MSRLLTKSQIAHLLSAATPCEESILTEAGETIDALALELEHVLENHDRLACRRCQDTIPSLLKNIQL